MDTVRCVKYVNAHSKIPRSRTRSYSMEVDARGELLFNDESPDDVRQGTLDEIDREGEEAEEKPKVRRGR